jgi:hypothetical protein
MEVWPVAPIWPTYLGQGLVLAAVQPDGLHHGGVKEEVIIEELMDARIEK